MIEGGTGEPPTKKQAKGSTMPEKGSAPASNDAVLPFPKASIKRIMKLDADTKQISSEAVIAVAKATELFVDKLAKAAHTMAASNNRKTIKYEDIADARAADKNMEFLDGVIPQV